MVFPAGEAVTFVLDHQRPVDHRHLTITSQRALFHGSKHLREWPFGDVISSQFVKHVAVAAASLRGVTDAHESPLLDAFCLVSSFIDADDTLSEDELGPLCEVMESRTRLATDFTLIENGAGWRSSPSHLFDALVVADNRHGTPPRPAIP